MHLTRLLSLAPLALAATDEGAAVNDGITDISNAVVGLTNALDAYTGGILETKPVFDASINIHYVNRRTYAEAVASSDFTQAESAAIVKNVEDSVGVTIPESVAAIEAKKPQFDAANVTSLVEATILLLMTDHETLSAAIGEKLTAAEVAPGLAAAGAIDASLAGAAAYFAV